MHPAFDGTPTLPADLDEVELVRGLCSFEPEAWEELFARDYPRLYRFAFVRTGDNGAAEDIASEVFEEAARRIGRFEFRGVPVSAWLFKIARNLTADHLTRRRRRRLVPLEEAEPVGADQSVLLESLVDVARAMKSLTREQQEVISLRFIGGCDLAETAAALNRSVGAVKLLQHRALQNLRKQLTGGDGERAQDT